MVCETTTPFHSNQLWYVVLMILTICFILFLAGEYESQFDGYGDEYDEEMDEDEMSKRSSESEGCGDNIQPSLPLSHSSDSSGKRLSKDSGTGSDIEQDSLRGYSRKSSHGRNSDSGLCLDM